MSVTAQGMIRGGQLFFGVFGKEVIVLECRCLEGKCQGSKIQKHNALPDILELTIQRIDRFNFPLLPIFGKHQSANRHTIFRSSSLKYG
jgi:hypothetical protein